MSDETNTKHDLRGTWNAEITFGEGPREGELEPVELTFLAGGVIIHSDEPILQANGRYVQPPRGIGEWSVEDDRLSYWFDEVRTDPAGRPTSVAHVRAEGTVEPDGQTFTAAGTGEVYGTAESWSRRTRPRFGRYAQTVDAGRVRTHWTRPPIGEKRHGATLGGDR